MASALRAVHLSDDAAYRERRAPHYADPQDVEDFAQNLPDKFLFCREMGHNWRPFSAGRHADGGFVRILRCNRCKTERHQELSHRGSVTGNHYVYPEDYTVKGLGRIVGDGRDALRLVSLTRSFKED